MCLYNLYHNCDLFCSISEQIHLFSFSLFARCCLILMISLSFYDLTDFCVWMWTLTRRPVLYCSRTVCTTSRPSSFATLDQILKQLETMLASTSLLRCVPRPPLATPALPGAPARAGDRWSNLGLRTGQEFGGQVPGRGSKLQVRSMLSLDAPAEEYGGQVSAKQAQGHDAGNRVVDLLGFVF